MIVTYMVGVCAILLTSFPLSIMFPTIFALGRERSRANATIGGSIMVRSVMGAGLAPPLRGFIATLSSSCALGYTVALTAYLVVVFYGFGHINVRPSSELKSYAALESRVMKIIRRLK